MQGLCRKHWADPSSHCHLPCCLLQKNCWCHMSLALLLLLVAVVVQGAPQLWQHLPQLWQLAQLQPELWQTAQQCCPG